MMMKWALVHRNQSGANQNTCLLIYADSITTGMVSGKRVKQRSNYAEKRWNCSHACGVTFLCSSDEYSLLHEVNHIVGGLGPAEI